MRAKHREVVMTGRIKVLALSVLFFIVSATGYAELDIGGILKPVTEEKIIEDLKSVGINDAIIDLNAKITIPEQHGNPGVDVYGTIIRPAGSEYKKLPVILQATPYRRESVQSSFYQLLKHDYIIMTVDHRGTGSSHGEWSLFEMVVQYDFKYIIDEWIPSQDWSDGKVGMFGSSYMAIIQLLVAGLVDVDEENGEPLHLKAIFPRVPVSDIYTEIAMPGGNLDLEFMTIMLLGINMLACLPPSLMGEITGMEADDPKQILEAARIWKTHVKAIPDSIDWMMNVDHIERCYWFDVGSPMKYWPVKPEGGWYFPEGERVIPAKLPVFTVGGWFDIFTRGTLNNYQYGFSNHSDSDKTMIIGEWYHMDGGLGLPVLGASCALEARWYDWKIKGKDDCFMEDFPVLLYIMGEDRWRAEKTWPLAESRVENKSYYLSKTEAGVIEGDWFTVKESNQIYSLVEYPEAFDLAGDDLVLEHNEHQALHGYTSRSSVRWSGGASSIESQVSKHVLGADINDEQPWEDERKDDWKILTFTTEPLKKDMEITGFLSLSFWAKTEFTSPHIQWTTNVIINSIKAKLGIEENLIFDMMNDKDVQWVVELNDVFPDGRARNITSGWQRASHRQYDPTDAPWLTEHALDPDYIPFDPFYSRSDWEPKPVKEDNLYQYSIELWPTSNVFKKGHRVRVTISASDFPHLLPILRPSRNSLVIDDDHLAKLDFKVVNRENEGKTWKWIGDANGYLESGGKSVNHYDPSQGTIDVIENDIDEEADSGFPVTGCGSSANVTSGKTAASVSSAFISLMFMMIFPFLMAVFHRLFTRRRLS